MKRSLLFALLLAISPMFLWSQVDETKPIKTSHAAAYVKSAPLAELAAKLSPDKADALVPEQEMKNELDYEKWPNDPAKGSIDNAQIEQGSKNSRGPLVGFNGQGGTGYYPPDTDGDVSETHFVQVVNSKYNVYLKDGTKVLGPLNLQTLWNELPGGPWGNSGDPIALYDELADRWVITQFAPRNSTHNYELFAVSETSDPLGSYHLYAFEFGVQFNDYPKIGVWHNGYFATYNLFSNNYNPSFVGAKVTAVNRDKMLVGDPTAEMVEFLKYSYYSTMPGDIDGEDVNEKTTCPIMYNTSEKKVEHWDLNPDWDTPSNSTLTLEANLGPFSFVRYNGTVPQPNGNGLDALGNMIGNRLAYRKFDDHESMVSCHTANVGGKAAVRWYEFRKTDGTDWDIYQYGTYAPGDGAYRWMASIAMNGDGDIALGYSVSNGTDIHPSIRYTGRHDGDELGEMTIEEVELKTGTTSQTSFSRWGDYSCMNVDPENDTVFWFTTEYNGWKTWIASFDLGGISGPSCNAGPDAYICTNDQFETQGSGSGVLDMQWTTDGDGFFSPDNAFNSTYIRGNNDVANGGCTLTLTVTGFDGETTDADDMYLNIVSNPTCDAGDDASINPDQSYTLQATATHPGDITWTSNGDGTFSDASILNPIYTPGTNDIATGGVDLNIHVEPINPCEGSADDDMHLGIITGVNDIANNPGLSIYPNPTNDIFTLNVNKLNSGDSFTFIVYTSYGKEIYRQLVTAKSNTYKKVIDMSDFVAGIYFVKVQAEKGTTTMKVVKK